MLEAIRQVDPTIRFYQASSSEMFGKVREVPQTETTPFHPRSPYGVAKAYGHFLTVNYRESYGLYAVSGILFNHESPRRGLEFVTRKVTDGAARIALGLADRAADGQPRRRARLGLRRRLRAGDVADAPAARAERLRRRHRRGALGPRALPGRVRPGRASTTSATCAVDPALYRPAEVDHLLGDASKARAELGWAPTVSFEQMVEDMVDADVARHEARLGRAARAAPAPM